MVYDAYRFYPNISECLCIFQKSLPILPLVYWRIFERTCNPHRVVKANCATVILSLVLPKVFLSGPVTRILKRGDKNINITCYGNGYPQPTVLWTKKGEETIPQFSEFSPNYTDRVVQVVSSHVMSLLDNVTSRLYLRTDGITYKEAGNYTCSANIEVGGKPAEKIIEVLCE